MPFAFLRFVPQILVLFVVLSDKKPPRNFWYVTFCQLHLLMHFLGRL